MKPLSMPFQVGWDIVHLCNYRCGHCYFSKAQLSDKRWIDRQAALDFVDHLIANKVFHLSIAGGEPLLHPHLVEVVAAATRGGISVAMSTNASLLNEQLATQLWDAGLRTLQISLDGSSAEINDSIRGSGTFAKTTAGLQVALKAGYSIYLAIVLLQANKDDIFDFLSWASRLGVRGVKVQTLIDAGLGHDNKEILEIPSGELMQLLRKLWTWKTETKPPIEIMLPLIPSVIDQLKDQREPYYRHASCAGCQPGLSTVRVNATGDVRACGGFVDAEPVGNILDKPLKEIWKESAEIARWRNQAELDSGSSVTSCGSICGKGCRAASAPAFAKTD